MEMSGKSKKTKKRAESGLTAAWCGSERFGGGIIDRSEPAARTTAHWRPPVTRNGRLVPVNGTHHPPPTTRQRPTGTRRPLPVIWRQRPVPAHSSPRSPSTQSYSHIAHYRHGWRFRGNQVSAQVVQSRCRSVTPKNAITVSKTVV